MSMKSLIPCAALLAIMLAGCSGVPLAQRESQRQAAYAAAAGASVRSFRFFNLYSWEPLDNGQMAVYTKPNEAWLLDLGGACPNLEFASAIGLTSQFDQVSVGFDKVLTGRGNYPCTITGIRPVDVSRLKLEQQAQRKINAEQREAAKTPPAQ
ncbi:MAG TPA: DUF6491 family protein [Rhodanobacter sp.]